MPQLAYSDQFHSLAFCFVSFIEPTSPSSIWRPNCHFEQAGTESLYYSSGLVAKGRVIPRVSSPRANKSGPAGRILALRCQGGSIPMLVRRGFGNRNRRFYPSRSRSTPPVTVRERRIRSAHATHSCITDCVQCDGYTLECLERITLALVHNPNSVQPVSRLSQAAASCLSHGVAATIPAVNAFDTSFVTGSPSGLLKPDDVNSE